MWICSVCYFETELDDAVVRQEGWRCICLRCLDRATGSSRPMPKALRWELIRVLRALEATGEADRTAPGWV